MVIHTRVQSDVVTHACDAMVTHRRAASCAAQAARKSGWTEARAEQGNVVQSLNTPAQQTNHEQARPNSPRTAVHFIGTCTPFPIHMSTFTPVNYSGQRSTEKATEAWNRHERQNHEAHARVREILHP